MASRNRLAAQLSDAKRYTTYMEAELVGRSADVGAAATSLSEASRRLRYVRSIHRLTRPAVISLAVYVCVAGLPKARQSY